MTHFNLESYLKRIDFNGSREVNFGTLSQLQAAHLSAVPFENLSIHWNQPIMLDDEALFEKIVIRRRGGFCYELNGLFSKLLREMGFEVWRLAAAVARDREQFTPDFAHMTLMVCLDERWLVDVGFGDSFREPLRLDFEGIQEEPGASYRVIPEQGYCLLFEKKLEGEWQPQYRFTLEEFEYPDFEPMCHFQQYSPESHFRKGRVITRTVADGRLTLSEGKLIRSWLDGRREEEVLADEAAFDAALYEYFGIVANS